MNQLRIVRMLLIALALSLLFAAAAHAEKQARSSAGTDPVIAVDYVPAYGDQLCTSVNGVVFREDGKTFNPDRYRLTLYLQVNPGEQFWVKPYSNQTTTEIAEDGSFSIRFVTGNNDYNAHLLVVLLIPADFTPGSNYNAALEAALDCVTVTRSENGENSIEPSRNGPTPGASALPSGLKVSKSKIALDVGFHTDGSYPGSTLSNSLIRQHLNAIAPYCKTVRFYSASDEVSPAYSIARGLGFKVLGSAWLSKDKTANKKELNALIEHCNNGDCSVAIVGSETLLRGDLTPSELIEAIWYVRNRLDDETIPVTTADSFHMLTANPAVCNACSFILANCYPYWSGASIDDAEANLTRSVATLNSVSRGKEIMLSETGWPTQGQSVNDADAGDAEAARYYEIVRNWSLRTGVNVLYFSSVDEPWKVRDEGAAGGAWGLFDSDFTLKECYSVCNPFGTGGVYGGNVFWKLEGGKLTLWLAESAENSEMPDLPEDGSVTEYPWAAYAAKTKSIVIRKGLSSVSAFAFADGAYASVSKLKIPTSVTGIGESAFSGCTGLSAVIPASVTEVGINAFADSADVSFYFPGADFVLPGRLKSVGQSAFEGIRAVGVRVPDGCSSIGARAFAVCRRLERILIPGSVKSIASDAFAGCGTVYVYGEAGSAAEAYCAKPAHANCRFLLLEPESD